jgi:hypothetical protein
MMDKMDAAVKIMPTDLPPIRESKKDEFIYIGKYE